MYILFISPSPLMSPSSNIRKREKTLSNCQDAFLKTNSSCSKSISIRKSSGSDLKSSFKKVGSPTQELILAQEAIDNILAAAPERKPKKFEVAAREKEPLSPSHKDLMLSFNSPTSPSRKNNFESEGKHQLENLKKMIEMRIVDKNKITYSASKTTRNLSGGQKPKKKHTYFLADESQKISEEKPDFQAGRKLGICA